MEPTNGSLNINISEYGKKVVSYSDTDYHRFIERAKALITEHLNKSASQKTGAEVKNIDIHIFTY